MRVHRERLAAVAGRLEACGALRPGLTTRRAGDVLWSHSGHGAWLTVRDLGWGWQRSADWLAEQAGRALLAPGGGAPPP